ncbi:Mu transposase C-terminal domain-containing protein [Rhodobacter sp. 24-YEA-8]|uniref:Mu transposase C-terminal domain-containing protein n=1 Tax=Rhodobacter sp. 24-YEA-8 TaxID=1884310 RepID=UPI00344E78AB
MSRRIRGDGVLFAGLSYNCPALREMFLHAPEREVEIRTDLFDLGWIAVKIGDGWHAAICNHQGFVGVRYTDCQEACPALSVPSRPGRVFRRRLSRLPAGLPKNKAGPPSASAVW